MKASVIESIHRNLREQGVQTDLGEDTRFDDIDIDSLGLYSMMAGVEDDHDIIVHCGEFAVLEGISDLTDLVIGKISNNMPLARAA